MPIIRIYLLRFKQFFRGYVTMANVKYVAYCPVCKDKMYVLLAERNRLQCRGCKLIMSSIPQHMYDEMCNQFSES